MQFGRRFWISVAAGLGLSVGLDQLASSPRFLSSFVALPQAPGLLVSEFIHSGRYYEFITIVVNAAIYAKIISLVLRAFRRAPE